jgi:CheY-like chemotaxis protein
MASRRPKVLVVEDDESLALSLHRSLYRKSDRFDVLVAATGEVGRELMREMRVDVLVADVHLPGMSGIDLVRWAAIESPQTHFIVMTGEGLAQIRDRTCDVGCLQVLHKPFDPSALLNLVLEAIDSRDHLYGSLSALSAVDLIQMLCLARKSALVRITSNDIIGSLLVRTGVLVHATWKRKVGEAAVREIVGATEGTFQIGPLPGDLEPTITRDWAHVVMDAVRALDEQGRDAFGSSDSWPAIRVDDILFEDATASMLASGADKAAKVGVGDVTPINGKREILDGARDVAALLDKGFAALRSGDLISAKICWQAAQKLEPDNRIIELNLRKLESMQAR